MGRFHRDNMAAMTGRLSGKRILITSADMFMGPDITRFFRSEGADVIADEDPLLGAGDAQALVERCGHLDAVIANFEYPAYRAKTVDIEDSEWHAGFDHMVHPLMRIVRAVSPQMIARRSGSIVVTGSSSPLRRMSPQTVSYVTARAAQLAFVRSAGHDLARHNVRLNAIAQNYVANPAYYPPEMLANPKFQERLPLEVPAGRIGKPEESGELALFLASENSTFIFGQVISHDGGWS
jgi:2-keto-3-deoxy-L-fuconate dehydrogenase